MTSWPGHDVMAGPRPLAGHVLARVLGGGSARRLARSRIPQTAYRTRKSTSNGPLPPRHPGAALAALRHLARPLLASDSRGERVAALPVHPTQEYPTPSPSPSPSPPPPPPSLARVGGWYGTGVFLWGGRGAKRPVHPTRSLLSSPSTPPGRFSAPRPPHPVAAQLPVFTPRDTPNSSQILHPIIDYRYVK